MRAKGGLLEFSLIGQEVSAWQRVSRLRGALVGMAGAVVAGVIALQTGAAAEAVQFVQNVIRRLLPRDGSPKEDGEDQGQSGQES
jgi:hypothetical protein